MGNTTQRNPFNPYAEGVGIPRNADANQSNEGLISTVVGSPNPSTAPNTGLILGNPINRANTGIMGGSIFGENKKPVPTASKPGTILGGQMYDPTKPAPGPVSGAVSPVTPTTPAPTTPPLVAPQAKPGETLEQFRERVQRQKGK